MRDFSASFFFLVARIYLLPEIRARLLLDLEIVIQVKLVFNFRVTGINCTEAKTKVVCAFQKYISVCIDVERKRIQPRNQKNTIVPLNRGLINFVIGCNEWLTVSE